MATGEEITKEISTLYDTINRIIEEAHAAVYRTANITMVRTYWHIGRVIVEEEQKGKERVEYGTELIKQLAKKLTKKTRSWLYGNQPQIYAPILPFF